MRSLILFANAAISVIAVVLTNFSIPLGVAIGIHPSPKRATRSKAFLELPPTHIGGEEWPSRRIGVGNEMILLASKLYPFAETGFPVQAFFIISMWSSNNWPLFS